MTSIPDSGWLTAIHKVAWWVSAAITAAAAVVVVLVYFDAPVFREIPRTVVAGIGVAGILFFFLLVFRWVDHFSKGRSSKVRRGVHKLTNQQRDFLLGIFRRGSRSFELSAGTGSPRWLEELKNWNYIKWHSPVIFGPGTPDYYSITEDGWLQLEKYQNKRR